MSVVNADLEAVREVLQNIKQGKADIDATKTSIFRKYQDLGIGWHDKKYSELGAILLECFHALDYIVKVLDTGESAVTLLLGAVQEYEGIRLNGSNGSGEGGTAGAAGSADDEGASSEGPRLLLSREEVNARYQSGLADIDTMIDNYKEALMDRGVPEGYWLSMTLAKHKDRMMEQLGYDLDFASGHGSDSIHNSEAYRYPAHYPDFYAQLANEFTQFCLKENNPNYIKDSIDEWYNNCQRCVPTYEMQRRGMDITAAPCFEDDAIAYNPYSVWESPQIIQCSGVGNTQIEETMRAWGDGARAQITVAWSETAGHTFVAEQIDGVTHYMDPQSGSEVYTEWIESAMEGHTQFCRIDNLQPSSVFENCYRRVQR